jgi:hypothetical protein
MVISSHRTYADAVSWMRHGRPADLDRKALAFRIFGGCLAVGIVGWGAGAYVNPESFGQPGGEVLSLGWPSVIYAALVVASAGALVMSRRRIAWVAARVREPYERALAEHPSYEGAVNALAACARPMQIRFAVGWTWGPMIAVVTAALLTLSTAYLVVYAVLSRFEVGWQTYTIVAGDAALALILLIAFAGRLSTWRVATSAYRAVILM